MAGIAEVRIIANAISFLFTWRTQIELLVLYLESILDIFVSELRQEAINPFGRRYDKLER
jgi:hypothetical protein